MPSAGGVAPPVVVPMRAPVPGRSAAHIDSATYLELSCETAHTKMYFTTDGSKPCPFQRKTGKDSTFKYTAPFTLKPGRRMLKAIAVSRDGLRESDTISRQFTVEDGRFQLKGVTRADDVMSMTDSTVTASEDFTPRRRNSYSEGGGRVLSSKMRVRRVSSGRQGTPRRKKQPVHEYVEEIYDDGQSEGFYDADSVADTYREEPYYSEPPAYHSRVQHQQPRHEHRRPPRPQMSQTPRQSYPNPYNPAWPDWTYTEPGHMNRLGQVTNNMIQSVDDSRNMTVAELKRLLDDHRNNCRGNSPPPPPLALEGPPRDPPVHPVSPANGDWRGQLEHVYAHLIQSGKQDHSFRVAISEPRFGTITNVEFEESDDGYMFRIEMDRIDKPKFKSKPKPKKEKKREEEPPRPAPKPKPAPAAAQSKIDTKQPVSFKQKKTEPDHPKPKPKPKDPEPYLQTEEYDQEGTVKPWPDFDATEDAETLRAAMKGLGTNEKVLIKVLAKRSATQRVAIAKQFKTMFGKDLAKEIDGETSGNFCQTLKALCLSPPEFDAAECNRAIKGLGTDDDCLIEIVCTRTTAQLKTLNTLYKEKYTRTLEEDVSGDTSGHYKRLLISLLQTNRPDTPTFDLNEVKADAQALYEAGEQKWGTDESRFNVILCSKSFAHLRAVFDEYKTVSKKDIEEAVKSEMSGDLCQAMLTVIRAIRYKPAFFAKACYKSMKGLGTADNTLIRVLVSRCEIDLVQIKKEFAAAYEGKSLAQFISDDCSGDYKNILLQLVNGNLMEDEDLPEVEKDADPFFQTEEVDQRGTLHPASPFNSSADCETLRKAMKGFGTDEDAIIEVLAFRSASQRQEIVKQYKTMFGKDLRKELDGETSGNFCTLLKGLCLAPAEYDVNELKKAIKGAGTDEECLIEIICTRTNAQLKMIIDLYKTTHGVTLEEDIQGDTSGHFGRLLVSLVQANRPEGQEFDLTAVKADAQELLEAGEKKWGTDESRFNVILCSRSYAHLRAVFKEYKVLAKKDIEDSIKSEMSGDICKGMLTVVQVIKKKSTYFAGALHKSMKGLGTDDNTLCRIVVSRCEIDMYQIKREFQSEYNQTLVDFIKDDTSGDYRKTLLALIGEDWKKK